MESATAKLTISLVFWQPIPRSRPYNVPAAHSSRPRGRVPAYRVRRDRGEVTDILTKAASATELAMSAGRCTEKEQQT